MKKKTKIKETPESISNKEKDDILKGKMNKPEVEPDSKEPVEPDYTNDSEKEAIKADAERAMNEGADVERMRRATSIVSGLFNLDESYHVTKYDDKGKVISLSLENKDFVLNVQIKDGNRHGLTSYEE